MPNPTARVLVDGSSGHQFDYAVPNALAGRLRAGHRVRVPLRQRASVGTVLSLGEAEDVELPFALREILALVDEEPLLTAPLLRLADWIADYYDAPLDVVIQAMLPQAAREGDEAGRARKQVRLTGELPEDLEALQKRAPRQAELLHYLREQPGHVAPLNTLIEQQGFGRGSITALEKRGTVCVEEVRQARDPYAGEEFLPSEPIALNAPQGDALQAILEGLPEALADSTTDATDTAAEPAKPLLLHGVTGSGKTEVYLQAIQAALDRGQGAIVLVPEISLTPQTAERFKRRFASIQDQVAVLHSHLSAGERHDEWRKILRRQARIVIGARSAIFAPIDRLGLIVVDEEHEHSYKQESPPRYHARDIAVVRGRIEGSTVVLGSATPSLESWQNARNGKYRLLSLPERVDDRRLPLIRIIDMRQESGKAGAGPAILSHRLRQSIEERVAEGEQVILFLNRRGFARSLLCPDCGLVVECRHCSIPLTFHRSEDRLLCHLCGFSRVVPRRCPECRSKAILFGGFGTERVEEVLRKVFPAVRLARVDADAMRRKGELRRTLDAFKAHKIDLLLGTQMIAKGLHFPKVTLVGILNADVGLHVPDIRAGERTFQLLTQVAGRAGRGDVDGEVIVQTFTPHHPAIQFSRHHDFKGYAEQELDFRGKFEYPPFTHLVLVTARSAHEKRAEFSLQTLHRRLTPDLPASAQMGEPLPSPLVRSHGQFRFQVLLRSPRPRPLVRHIRQVLDGLSFPEDVIVTVDVDPYQLS